MTIEELTNRLQQIEDCQTNFMNQVYTQLNTMSDTLRSLEMKYYTMEAQLLVLLQRRP
jgi:hypothetical protein